MYRSPCAIIIDNGTQFMSNKVQDWASTNNILMLYALEAHSQSNGQVEFTNHTLKEGLKKCFEGAKGNWVQKLSSVLWDYGTTTCTPIGEPPFSVVYGTYALLSIKVDLPTKRTLNYNTGYNIQAFHAKLDLIKQLHEDVKPCMMAYKQQWNYLTTGESNLSES